jgi:hypothetical protein
LSFFLQKIHATFGNMKASIGLRAALSEANEAQRVFAITYRTKDGTWGQKTACFLRRSGSNNSLNERKKQNAGGLLKCIDKYTGQAFDVVIDLILTFDGQNINFLQ